MLEMMEWRFNHEKTPGWGDKYHEEYTDYMTFFDENSLDNLGYLEWLCSLNTSVDDEPGYISKYQLRQVLHWLYGKSIDPYMDWYLPDSTIFDGQEKLSLD